MNSIFNAVYALIFLSFLRKVGSVVTCDIDDCISEFHVDSSGCWNLLIGDVPVAYSFNRTKIRMLAKDIKKAVPRLGNRIRLVEDEDEDCLNPDQIPGLSVDELIAVGMTIRRWDDS